MLVVFQYVETIEQFDAEQLQQLQVVLPIERANELAATINKAVKLVPSECSNCLVQ